MLKSVELCEVLDRTNHLAGVGVLVVVPRNNLYLVGIVVDLCNHGLGCIEERTVGDADDIGGNELFLGVTEGSGGSSLHSSVDAVNGNVLTLNNCDEDGGGMTSFVVFSSLGFYPVTPGSASYNIGSPLFTNAKITLSSGNIFEIEAINASEDNKYIQSATLNGKDWNKPWFSHDDIKNGAKLVLIMGDKPNKEWGSADDAVPPSID